MAISREGDRGGSRPANITEFSAEERALRREDRLANRQVGPTATTPTASADAPVSPRSPAPRSESRQAPVAETQVGPQEQQQTAPAPAPVVQSGEAPAFVRPGGVASQQDLAARHGVRIGAIDPRNREQSQIDAITALLSGGAPVAGAGQAAVPPSFGYRPNQFEDEQRILQITNSLR